MALPLISLITVFVLRHRPGCKPVWRQVARSGRTSQRLWRLLKEAFAGTLEAGAEESGHVYRHLGGQSGDCGSPDVCNSVASLAVYNGELYAVSLAEPKVQPFLRQKQTPGWNIPPCGRARGVDCGRLPDADSVICLRFSWAVVCHSWCSQGVFAMRRYPGFANTGRRLMSLAVFAGDLYVMGNRRRSSRREHA